MLYIAWEEFMKDIDHLKLAVSELAKTNLLNALEGIKKVLVVIASKPSLAEILKKSAVGFDFATEFEKIFVKKQLNSDDNAKYISLIAALLYQLDEQNISLEQLLNIAYPNIDKNKAYSMLLEKITMPFLQAYINLDNGQQKDLLMDAKPRDLDKINSDIKQYINVVISKVEHNINLDTAIKNEILSALYGLNYCLQYNDVVLTRVVYNGLINTLLLFQMSFDELAEIHKLLKLYGVL